MKLYKAKIPAIATDIVGRLLADRDIEVADRTEAEMDIQSVLKEYLRLDREITDRAKDLLEQRQLSREKYGRVRRSLSEQQGFGTPEEAITWICNQILETFMQSAFVEEIFGEDAEMRKKMREVLKRHMTVDDELDEEVRERIKNLQEGGSQWDVEYARVMDQIRRKRGLDRD